MTGACNSVPVELRQYAGSLSMKYMLAVAQDSLAGFVVTS